MQDLVRVELPDGQLVWARVDLAGPGDVAFGRSAPQVLTGLGETIRGVATNVRDGLRDARPDEVTVEFGVELATADGGLVAALAGVRGTASITVTLSWTGDRATNPPEPTGPASGPARSRPDAGS